MSVLYLKTGYGIINRGNLYNMRGLYTEYYIMDNHIFKRLSTERIG